MKKKDKYFDVDIVKSTPMTEEELKAFREILRKSREKNAKDKNLQKRLKKFKEKLAGI